MSEPKKKAKKKPKKKSGLPVGVRRHGSGFRAVVAINGVRERSLTLPTAEAAADWRDAFLAAKSTPINRPLDITLGGALQLILEDLQATGGKPGTREFYEAHARTLFAHLGGKQAKLHQITSAQLRSFIEKRREAGVEASTIVKRELLTLKRMRKLAKDAGYALPLDPFAGLRLPKVRIARFEFLTQSRVAELVAAMRAHRAPLAQWHADVVELLFATGMRISELTRTKVRDIDFAGGRIHVEGKTGPRDQTFGKSLTPLLRRMVAAAGQDGQLIASPDGLVAAFATWQKRLGEPRLSPHVLRHSYGTAMADHVTPFDLMGLMGHKSLSQTSRYFHARGDAVRNALDSLQLGLPAPEPSRSAPDPAAESEPSA